MTTDLAGAPTPETVLAFWLGPDDGSGAVSAENMKAWFNKDDAFDRQIEAEFGEAIERAARGELDSWNESPLGWLAQIILLDQFSRNVWRGTARAFAQDERALAVAEAGLVAGHDQALGPVARTFAYMPFMHSEKIEDQVRGVELFQKLAKENALHPQIQYLVAGSQFAVRHHDVIEKFGRFPHRNAALERESTAAEIEFLKRAGTAF